MVVLMDTRADLTTSVGPIGRLGLPKHHIVSPPAGHPNMGGFWFLWDNSKVSVEIDRTTERVAHFKLNFQPPAQAVQMSAVYNYAQPSRHNQVWNELISYSSSIHLPWIDGGISIMFYFLIKKWG